MAKFTLVYHGGAMTEGEEAQQAVMDTWFAWFGALGPAIVDAGAPFGPSATIAADGSSTDGGGANPATGYSIIEALDLDDATAKAKGCPVLASGGSVEVCEALPIG